MKKKVPTKKAKKKAPKKRLSNVNDVPNKGVAQILEEAAKKKGWQKGNQLWEIRTRHGRRKEFETPEEMWKAACEYFQWCIDNPLKEQKAFSTRTGIQKVELDKVRAFTLAGLALYTGVDTEYYTNFKRRIKNNEVSDNGFLRVIDEIVETIKNQKFEAAAADLLNANIISRDLQLVDRIDNSVELRDKVAKAFPDSIPT